MIHRMVSPCLLLMAPLASGAVSWTVTLDTITTSYSSQPDPFLGGTDSETRLTASGTPASPIDFSALGDTEFSITLQAPAGSVIQVSYPSGWDSAYFRAAMTSSGSSGTGAFIDNSPDIITMGYSLISGTDWSSSSTKKLQLPGVGGNLYSTYENMAVSVGSVYQFESITFTTTVPASYNEVLNPSGPSFYLITRVSSDSPLADAGPLVSLVSVPEPVTSGLLAAGGLVGLRRRRRVRPC